MNTQLLGRAGEAKAAAYLRRKGYTIVAAGFRCRYGEIDLIARKRDIVAFVEVKLRKNDQFAPASAAVDKHKQDRIKRTALVWMAQEGKDWQFRFDVVEIYTQSDKLNHIENAFQ